MQQIPPPWYKQFWPWFLIVIPVITMIASFMLITLAVDGNDSMVIDDYYKEGKAINLQLEKIQKARDLGIKTRLTINDDKVTLRFVGGEPKDGAALEMNFHHATLEENDFKLMLTRNAAGVYVADLEQPIDGKWYIRVLPFHQQWKLQDSLMLPRTGEIILEP